MSPDLRFEAEDKMSSADLVGHMHIKDEMTQLADQEAGLPNLKSYKGGKHSTRSAHLSLVCEMLMYSIL